MHLKMNLHTNHIYGIFFYKFDILSKSNGVKLVAKYSESYKFIFIYIQIYWNFIKQHYF